MHEIALLLTGPAGTGNKAGKAEDLYSKVSNSV